MPTCQQTRNIKHLKLTRTEWYGHRNVNLKHVCCCVCAMPCGLCEEEWAERGVWGNPPQTARSCCCPPCSNAHLLHPTHSLTNYIWHIQPHQKFKAHFKIILKCFYKMLQSIISSTIIYDHLKCILLHLFIIVISNWCKPNCYYEKYV